MDVLEDLHSNVRDKHLSFDSVNHIYTVNGIEYTPVTTLVKSFLNIPSLNPAMNSRMDEGKKLHLDIEMYYKSGSKKTVNTIEFETFQTFVSKHQELIPYRSEWQVYNEDLRLAGTIDMVFTDKSGNYIIYDWKNSKYITSERLVEYTLQLNLYAHILETKYNIVVYDMYLLCIHSALKICQKRRPERMDVGKILFKLEEMHRNRKDIVSKPSLSPIKFRSIYNLDSSSSSETNLVKKSPENQNTNIHNITKRKRENSRSRSNSTQSKNSDKNKKKHDVIDLQSVDSQLTVSPQEKGKFSPKKKLFSSYRDKVGYILDELGFTKTKSNYFSEIIVHQYKSMKDVRKQLATFLDSQVHGTQREMDADSYNS